MVEHTMVVLKLAAETVKHLQAWLEKKAPPSPPSFLPFPTKKANPTMTTTAITYQLFQKTPQEICTAIPSSCRIPRVEEVLRTDLVGKF